MKRRISWQFLPLRDAIANAKRNGIENIRFFVDDASDFLLRDAENGEKLDAVIMDPPQSGSTERFLESACKVKPKRIVPIDNFPLTEHVETVVLMSRVAPYTHSKGANK